MEKEIVNFLTEKISPYLLIIFGSTAKGTIHDKSDIDIAFLSDHIKIDKYEQFMIAQDLAAKVNWDIDLVDLSKASTVFQAQIVNTGKIIFCSDELKRANYEMKVLKKYAKLNEERSQILKNVDESGSIYEK
jgi:predicted nucleotidyltransferase